MAARAGIGRLESVFVISGLPGGGGQGLISPHQRGTSGLHVAPQRRGFGQCQAGTHLGVVRPGQGRMGGKGGAAGILRLHDSILPAGSNLSLCGAEQFVLGAHRLSLLVKHGGPVAVEQVFLGAGGGLLGGRLFGGQNVAAGQLTLAPCGGDGVMPWARQARRIPST